MGGPHEAASLPKEQPCPSAGSLCQGPAATHGEKGGSEGAGESLLGKGKKKKRNKRESWGGAGGEELLFECLC